MTRPQQKIANPDDLDVLLQLRQDIFYRFNCHRVGRIEKFNSTNQTATIQLLDYQIRPTIYGSTLTQFPPLVNCPLIFLCGGNGGFLSPPKIGDTCYVLFNDRDLSNWQTAGGFQDLDSPRAHSLNDAVAIIGLRDYGNSIANFPTDHVKMFWESGAEVKVYEDKAKMAAPGGAEITVDDKVEIKNTAETLKNLIANLITTIKNIQVTDPISGTLSVTPATVTALNNLQTEFDLLIK